MRPHRRLVDDFAARGFARSAKKARAGFEAARGFAAGKEAG
jgi:hypothetical protein